MKYGCWQLVEALPYQIVNSLKNICMKTHLPITSSSRIPLPVSFYKACCAEWEVRAVPSRISNQPPKHTFTFVIKENLLDCIVPFYKRVRKFASSTHKIIIKEFEKSVCKIIISKHLHIEQYLHFCCT